MEINHLNTCGTLQVGEVMFKRGWLGIGKLKADEGFTLAYGNRSITYSDERGSFMFAHEDGLLFPSPSQISGEPITLDQAALDAMIERVLSGIRFEGHIVEIHKR